MTIENTIHTIRAELDDARRELLRWTDEDVRVLQHQPRAGGWTSLQVLEHITLTNHYLLLLIAKASDKAMQRAARTRMEQDWASYELSSPALDQVGIHKSFSWARPEHMEPTEGKTPDEIRRLLIEQFDRCEKYLVILKNGEGTLCTTTMTVNGLGKLDVYQYIYFLGLHAKRHLTQLASNRKDFESSL